MIETTVQGLYLKPPHGELIANGTKVAIAKGRPMGLEGEWILLSGRHAYGHMRVGQPEEVPIGEFKTRHPEHGVSEKERLRWWPERSPLYLYPIEEFQPYPEGPVTIKLPPGVQTRVDIKGMGLPDNGHVDNGHVDDLLPAPPLKVQSLRLKVRAAGTGQPRTLQDGKEVVVVRAVKARRISLKAARWRTLKDGRTVAISGTEKRGAMSSRGEAAIRNIERDLIDDGIESAVVLDPNGEMIFKKGGERTSVTFTESEMDGMLDAVLTHNHPVSGGSFSPEDVWMAIKQSAAEVRVVGIKPGTKERYLYRMTRPEDGWGWDHPGLLTQNGFEIAFSAHYRKVFGEFSRAMAGGKMSIDEANFKHFDTVWSRMSKTSGWEYSMERL